MECGIAESFDSSFVGSSSTIFVRSASSGHPLSLLLRFRKILPHSIHFYPFRLPLQSGWPSNKKNARIIRTLSIVTISINNSNQTSARARRRSSWQCQISWDPPFLFDRHESGIRQAAPKPFRWPKSIARKPPTAESDLQAKNEQT